MTEDSAPRIYMRMLFGQSEVEIGIPRLNARYRVDARSLTEQIFNGSMSVTDLALQMSSVWPTLSDSEKKHRQEWIDKGWEDSLDLYEASLAGVFADESDPHNCVRATVIDDYLAETAPPSRCIALTDKEVQLPTPQFLPEEEFDFVGLLLNRKTTRSFDHTPLSLKDFSTFLHAGFSKAQACLKQREEGKLLISHAVWTEPFIAVYNVEKLSPGLYHYDMTSHVLRHHGTALMPQDVTDILWAQGAPKTASFSIFLFADYAQYQWLYRQDKALRNLYIDSGLLAQALILTGERVDLGCFMTPAMKDEKLLAVTELPRERFGPVYALTFGFRLLR